MLAGLAMGLFMFGVVGMAQAAPIQWSSNNHWYDVIDFNGTWDQANANAQNQTYNGIQGHLATLTSSEENDFVWTTFKTNEYWLGGYQTDKTDEPTGNWAWVTGESWSYTNWASSEPNNAGGNEDHIHFWHSNGSWNDMHNNYTASGYVVEYDAVPIPGAVWLLGSGLLGLIGIRRRRQK